MFLFHVECQNFIDDKIYNKDLPYMYEQQQTGPARGFGYTVSCFFLPRYWVFFAKIWL